MVSMAYVYLSEKEKNLKSLLFISKVKLISDNEIKFHKSYENDYLINYFKRDSTKVSNEVIPTLNFAKLFCKLQENLHELQQLLKNDQLEESIVTKINLLTNSIKNNLKILKSSGEMKRIDLDFKIQNIMSDIRNMKVHLSEKPSMELANNSKPIGTDQVVLSEQTSKKVKGENFIGFFQHSWHHNDHKLFLQIFNHHQCSIKRKEEFYKTLNHISSDEIDKHYSNYLKFVENADKVKLKIELWKKQKAKNECVLPVITNNKVVKKLDRQKSMSIINTISKKKFPVLKTDVVKVKRNSTFKQDPLKDIDIYKSQFRYTEKERKEIQNQLIKYKEEKNLLNQKTLKNQEEETRKKAILLAKFLKRDSKLTQDKLQKIKLKSLKSDSCLLNTMNRCLPTKHTKTMSGNYLKPTYSHLVRATDQSKLHTSFMPIHIDCSTKRRIPDWRVNT